MATSHVFLLALIFIAARSNATADGKEPPKTAHAATSGPVQAWVALYNGPANSFDNAKAMAVDGAGNVALPRVARGAVAAVVLVGLTDVDDRHLSQRAAGLRHANGDVAGPARDIAMSERTIQ